jgi:hypothetical protein
MGWKPAKGLIKAAIKLELVYRIFRRVLLFHPSLPVPPTTAC